MLLPKMSVEAICALFGKTRQAYYQRLSYKYEEQAGDGFGSEKKEIHGKDWRSQIMA